MNRIFTYIAGVLLVLALGIPAQAAKSVGVFTVVKGDIKIQKPGKTKLKKAKVGTKIKAKDIIVAGKNSRAKITMLDNNILNISPDTKLELANYKMNEGGGDKNVTLNLVYGKVRSSVKQKYDGKKNTYRVKTKSAVAGVRGTDFIVGFNAQSLQSNIVTFEGQVEVGSGVGNNGQILNAVKVNPGQFTNVSANSTPKPPAAVPKAQLNALNKSTSADSSGSTEEREPSSDKGNNDKKKDEKEKKEQPKDTKKDAKRDQKQDRKDNKQQPKQSQTSEKRDTKQEPKNGPDNVNKDGNKNANNNNPADGPAPRDPASTGPENKGDSAATGPDTLAPTGPQPGEPGLTPDGDIAGGANGSEPNPTGNEPIGMLPPPPPPVDLEPIGPELGGEFQFDPCASGACDAYIPPTYDEGIINDVIQDQNARVNIIINGP